MFKSFAKQLASEATSAAKDTASQAAKAALQQATLTATQHANRAIGALPPAAGQIVPPAGAPGASTTLNAFSGCTCSCPTQPGRPAQVTQPTQAAQPAQQAQPAQVGGYILVTDYV